MGVEQIYNPVSGINRMITDIENSLEPILFELHPVLRLFSNINMQMVCVVFAALMFYLLFVRKHGIKRKLKDRKTYFILIGALLLFEVLNKNPLKIGPSFNFNFGIIVMPIVSKFLGPVLAAFFGVAQYMLQFLMYGAQSFDFPMMLIGGISGILYALFIYDKKTKYVRCFVAKLSVNLICNILLVPMVKTDSMTTELAKFISDRLIENVFLVPIQALVIWGALKLVRKLLNSLKYKKR